MEIQIPVSSCSFWCSIYLVGMVVTAIIAAIWIRREYLKKIKNNDYSADTHEAIISLILCALSWPILLIVSIIAPVLSKIGSWLVAEDVAKETRDKKEDRHGNYD